MSDVECTETYLCVITTQERTNAHEDAPEEGAPVDADGLEGCETMLGRGSLGEGEAAGRGAPVDARHLGGVYFLCCRGHGWGERERNTRESRGDMVTGYKCCRNG